MADLQPVEKLETSNRPTHIWEDVTDALEPVEARITGGIYSATAEGEFGGASFEFQYSKFGTEYHTIDLENLTFTENGTWNIEIGAGFIKPIRTGGGGSTSVSLALSSINNGIA